MLSIYSSSYELVKDCTRAQGTQRGQMKAEEWTVLIKQEQG